MSAGTNPQPVIAAHPTSDFPTANQAPLAYSEPSKYGLFFAIGEATRAIFANVLAYVMAFVASILLTGIVYVLLAIALIAALASSLNGTSNAIISIIGVVILALVVLSFVNAYTLITASVAVADGKAGRHSIIKKLLLPRPRLLLRVLGAEALAGLIIIVPLLVLVILSSVLAASGGGGGAAAIVILGGLLGVAWVIIAALRFALTPYVALFDQSLPLLKTLGQSNHLLRGGGQWFLIKGFLIAIIVYILISFLGGSSSASTLGSLNTAQSLFGNVIANNIAGSILSLLFGIISQAVLTVLYLNRAAVRGTK